MRQDESREYGITKEAEYTMTNDCQGKVNLTALQQMVSSCSGAILTSLFVTPLDVVKIRLQAQQRPQRFQKGACFLYCNGLMDHVCPCNGNGVQGVQGAMPKWYKRPGHFTGMTDAFVQIGRMEGFSSLWSGLPPTLVMALPATVIYFTCYEQLKALLGHTYSGSYWDNWWKPVASGTIARVWAVTVISPLELLRTKMQSRNLSYRQLQVALVDTVRQDGYRALWNGLGSTLLRDVPFSALYWLSYETMKTKVMHERGTTKLTFMESFTTGALAGTLSGILTLPFDVIKTHRQIELGEVVLTHEKKQAKSTWALIQQLYRSQGIKALFAGLTPRVVKVAPACAIMISSYEFFKCFFTIRNEIPAAER